MVLEEKLLAMRQKQNSERPMRPSSVEKHISCYEVAVPDTFAPIINRKGYPGIVEPHALAERSTGLDYGLSFSSRYHRFVLLLFDESQWVWNAESYTQNMIG